MLGSSMQKLKSRLPVISGKRRLTVVTQPIQRKVLLTLKNVPRSRLVSSEKHPVDLKRRSQYFVDMYNEGRTISPILVHKLSNGDYQILDGHARVYAYYKLGVTKIPAVENEDVKQKDKPVAVISSKPDKPVITPEQKTELRKTREYVRDALDHVLEEDKPKTEAAKAWKPKGYEFTEQVKEERKGAIGRGIKRELKKIGRGVTSTVEESGKPIARLSQLQAAARSGQGLTVTIRGIPTEIPASEVKALLADRQRAVAGEYLLEPIELKAFATRPWKTRPPLLEGAGSPFSRPPVKKYRKHKKTGRRFEFEGKGRVH